MEPHPRASNLDYDEHHPVAEGEHGHNHGGGDEHHQEHGHKSVMKKVKAKAKKIKETLTKHGNNHEHEEGHTHAEHDEEEDEDEEMVDDPEIHGAPMYESSAIKGGMAGPQSGVNLAKPTSATDRNDPHITDPPTRPFGAGQEKVSGHAPTGNIPSATPWTSSGQERMPMKPAAATDMPSATPWMNPGQHTTTPTAAPHGTHALAHEPSPYATHGTHTPANTTTAHEPPLSATQGTNVTGSTHEGVRQPSSVRLGPSIPSSLDEDPHAPRDRPKPSNYQSKVSDPTAAGEEAGITPLLHSMDKMRVHEEGDSHQKRDVAPEGYTGSHGQFSPETNQPSKTNETGNPEDMLRDVFTEPESTYTGKISSATSAITEKAVAAKNVVASKLGYGGEKTTDQSKPLGYGGETTTDQSSNTSSVSDYGNKIASSVTGTLAPVYDKVAGVGSTVMSKVSGGGGGAAGDGSGVESTVGQDKGTDKGVSVKEFLVGKLSPGEEDRALSKVITHSLYKDKAGAVGRKEEAKEEEKPMGKVTQSVEVTRRLGTGDEPEKKDGDGDVASANAGAAGQAVVERVKGWFGMGSPNSQPPSGTLLAGKKEESSKDDNN